MIFFYHIWNIVYKFGSFLYYYEVMASQGLLISKFWKIDGRSNFSHFKKKKKQKQNMDSTLELPIFVWWQYIALKLLGRITMMSKRGPCFTTSSKYFTKIFRILVLSYNLSHFVPIFSEID